MHFKDLGPHVISEITRRSIRIASKRLRRDGNTGEASRLIANYDLVFMEFKEFVIKQIDVVKNNPAKAVLRDLSIVFSIMWLEIELGSRKLKRKAGAE